MKSSSYLIFSLLFFLSTVDQIFVSIDASFLISEFIISINFVLIHLIIIQLSSEYNNFKLPISKNKLFLYGIITGTALITLKSLIYLDIISSNRENLKFIIGEPLRIIAGFMLIYSFRNSKLILKTKRTSIISSFWIVAAIVMFISGIIQFSIYTSETLYDILSGTELNESWIDIAVISGDLNAILLALIATTLALFYPESMLLTHVQLIKAARIYQILGEIERSTEIAKPEDRGLLSNLSSESLYEYISDLPDEIIDKLDSEKREKQDM